MTTYKDATNMPGNGETVSVDVTDYLDEDKDIPRQNFVCLSFLSPEDVIENRQHFVVKDFLSSFSKSMVEFADHLRSKFPTESQSVDAIVQAHPTIFKPEDIGADLEVYASLNKEALEKAYDSTHKFTTSVRGVKVRGTFNTEEEAKKHVKQLKKTDTAFDIYIASVGKWCPWSPCPEDIGDVEYRETHLNTLMKGYKSNIEVRDDAYTEDTSERIVRATASGTGASASEAAGVEPASEAESATAAVTEASAETDANAAP